MIGTLLLILLIVWVVGALPNWGYMQGRNYGYAPSGLGLILLVLVVLWLAGLFGTGHHLSIR